MMKCFLCNLKPKRSCPHCRRDLCNSHSRSMSTMKTMDNLGKRVCSNCKYHGDEKTFTAVSA